MTQLSASEDYFDTVFETAQSPIKNLWANVISRAIKDYSGAEQTKSLLRAEERRDAWRWLFLDEDLEGNLITEEDLGSFKYACSVLELDYLRIREVVRNRVLAKYLVYNK